MFVLGRTPGFGVNFCRFFDPSGIYTRIICCLLWGELVAFRPERAEGDDFPVEL